MRPDTPESLSKAQEISDEIDRSILANNYDRANKLGTIYCGILLTILVNELIQTEQPLMVLSKNELPN